MNRVSPRIHMTLWYVAIVSVVAVIFAGFIYQVTIANIMRHSMVLQSRMRASFNRPHLPKELLERIAEDQDEVEHLLLLRLTFITGAIIAAAAVASYHLAGKSLKPLEEAITLQKQFVTDTSHELKTPIAALRTHLEVALKEKKISQKEYKVALTEALETVIDMQEMIESMLSSSQSRVAQLQIEEIDLKPLVKKIVSRVNKTYSDKKLDFVIEIRNTKLYASRKQIEQLFTVTLDNAAKYSHNEGVVTVKSQTTKIGLTVTVTDEGQGIAEVDLAHIFDRFYRSDKARTRSKISGQGLGLSIAKRIVEDFGGEIEVESEEGKGTKVVMLLPNIG